MDAVAPSTRRTLGAMQTSDQHVLLVLVLATVVLRLPFLFAPLTIDEGGYAYVAARWLDPTGVGSMYGDQWVDRPPLLLAMYAVADLLGGAVALRVMGIVAACIVVVTSARAAAVVAGQTALRWTGVVSVVLTSSVVLQGQTVNAELPAIALTSTAAWLTVRAVTSTAQRHALVLAVGAGVSAASAVLVKQSFVDGFAFGVGLLACLVVLGGESLRRRAGVVLAGALAGTTIAAAFLALWAITMGPGLTELFDALYGFRIDARTVLDSTPSSRVDERAALLLAIGVLTGFVTLLAFVGVGLVRVVFGRSVDEPRSDRQVVLRSVAAGTFAMGAWGLVAVMLGGNWWTHYLLQLIPALALGAGIMVSVGQRRTRSRLTPHIRLWARVVLVTTAVTWTAVASASTIGGSQTRAQLVGDWLATASQEHDTAYVAWGHANVLERSGMRSPYPMVWSLPVRVRDPQLTQLRIVLGGPDAPTWFVKWSSINSWKIDDDRRLRDLLDTRYVEVATVCDVPILRRRDAAPLDQLPDAPDGATCDGGMLDPSRMLAVLRERTTTSPTTSA